MKVYTYFELKKIKQKIKQKYPLEYRANQLIKAVKQYNYNLQELSNKLDEYHNKQKQLLSNLQTLKKLTK